MSFKCPICYDEYNEKNSLKIPKILKCGCTLCFQCLNFSINKSKKVCPICTSEILENLEEIRTNIFAYNNKNAFVCSICLKEFDNNAKSEKAPKVLKCGETFCLECIKKNYKNGSIFCPTCAQTTQEKLEEIPINKLAIDLVEKEILNNIEFLNSESESSFEYEFSIGLLGEPGVGKTSITHYFYKGCSLTDSQATIGFEFHFKLMSIKEKKIKLRLWDTAGTEAYRSLAMGLLRGVDAVVIVFSLAIFYDPDIEQEKEIEWKNADEKKKEEISEKITKDTFNRVKSWYNQFSQFNDEKGKIIYLIGNKLDDVEHRVIKKEDAINLAKELNLKYFETSAITGENINQIFSKMSLDLMTKKSYSRRNTINLKSKKIPNVDKKTDKKSKNSTTKCC